MDSTVTVIGNTTRDVELKYLPSGIAVAEVSVAVNRRWTDKAGETKEEVSFFDVVLWESLALNAVESLPKGTRVVVTGTLRQRSWENDAGEKRSKVEIKADDIAPSLRWAEAKVTRNPKADGSPAERAPHTADSEDLSPF